MSKKYLKDKQYYIDRYDLITILKCLEAIDVHTSAYKELLENEKGKEFSHADQAKGSNWLANQTLFVIKAKRYELKEQTIQHWMLDDQHLQEKYDTTESPKGIVCPQCHKGMKSISKFFDSMKEPLRMMFLFECSSCKTKKWIFEDGTERPSTPILCSKCSAIVDLSVVKESKDKIIWKSTCTSCGFSEKTVDDLKKDRLKREKLEKDKKELLDAYRNQFCSEEEGKKSFEYIEALKVAPVVFEEEVRKYDSFAYQKVSELKRLTIVEVEKLLSEALEKENYIKFSFEKPVMDRHVVVPFSFQDATLRSKDKSIALARKLIKKLLEGTNWRLMSDGLSYRLGYLSGNVKGYETDEELLEISGEKTEERHSSKIDSELRQKYEGHNVVRLAHYMGEFTGIQNVRKRRLTKDPEGFFLEGNDDFYQCGICGDSMPAIKTWWNLDGVRCADCQRSIKEGIIPSEIHKNSNLYIKDWELTSKNDFGLASSTIRKLKRTGLLHGRELKREDGKVYFTVYLMNENKEFLKKYKRKPTPEWIITDLLGNKVNIHK